MVFHSRINRRALLLGLSSVGLAGTGLTTAGCVDRTRREPAGSGGGEPAPAPSVESSSDGPAILETFSLGARWKTFDPFLFCVHHDDAYPRGNDAMGPDAPLTGRDIGQDFAGIDGWRMYHGDTVPGFPRHPHRGFETVTVTRKGFIDHSDSLGATARYGQGDVQWMTAGAGIAHAEMFPLLDRTEQNPAELFQIWLNLPKRDKFVAPYFAMFWNEKIPEVVFTDDAGRTTTVRAIAGTLGTQQPPSPPPNSWASNRDSDLAIWAIKLAAGAKWQLPAPKSETDRTLYFFNGPEARVGGEVVASRTGSRLRRGVSVELQATAGECEFLLLQAKPIAEPVAQRGPFVMNDEAELRQAFLDYRRTQFGGWPWGKSDPVHSREQGRFAIHADGRKEHAI